MSGPLLSADFPDELLGQYAVVQTKKFQDFKSIHAIHGKTKAEASLLFDDKNPLIEADNGTGQDLPQEVVFFDPTILRANMRAVPPDPRSKLMNQLSLESINQFRHRLLTAFENRHRVVLEHHAKSFFKKKGELELFIDQGAVQVDLLPAWQPQQSRTMSATHALAVTRPGSEFYFDRYNQPHSQLQEFGNIERMATSCLLRERQLTNRTKSDRLLNSSVRHHTMRGGKVLPFAKTFVGPRKTISEQVDAHQQKSEITAFERNNHLELELKDLTKQELKRMIAVEGVEVPGQDYWDPSECVMKKAACPKEVYLQTARRAMVSNDKKPIIQRGKLIKSHHGPAFCIVSLFRCPMDEVARLHAYNQTDRSTYHLVLTKALLEDHDLKHPPRSSRVKRWLVWSKRVLDMLELVDGELHLGSPPLERNGLPYGFSLTGEDPPPGGVRRTGANALLPARPMVVPPPPLVMVGRDKGNDDEDEEDEEEGPKGALGGRRRRRRSILETNKLPSRKHVTQFFDSY